VSTSPPFYVRERIAGSIDALDAPTVDAGYSFLQSTAALFTLAWTIVDQS
jgi:hypothetical protein